MNAEGKPVEKQTRFLSICIEDSSTTSKLESLQAKIDAQGSKIRELKAVGTEKSIVEGEMEQLLALKAQYKELTA